MTFWRRILAVILAAAIAVSPALACAGFCSDAAAFDGETAEAMGDSDLSMPADCDDSMGGSRASGKTVHDPNCDGCVDCPAVASVKNPALASAGALSVDTPTVIMIDFSASPVADVIRPARLRLRPPANGPPIAATPVLLNDILRL